MDMDLSHWAFKRDHELTRDEVIHKFRLGHFTSERVAELLGITVREAADLIMDVDPSTPRPDYDRWKNFKD